MAKKKHSRSQAYRATGEQPVQSWDARLGGQNGDANESTAQAENLSSPSSHSVPTTPSLPKNVVLVRYSKGKDNLLLEDAISHETITLTPGDSRHVHMNIALMKNLISQGFEFESK